MLPTKLKPLAVDLNSCPNKATQAQLGRNDNSARIRSEQSGLKKREASAVSLDCTSVPTASKRVNVCTHVYVDAHKC